jgi:hypothetical protein
MEKITKNIIKAKKEGNMREVQQLQQEYDKKYTFLTNRKTGATSNRVLKDNDLRYCHKTDCIEFINPNEQKNYLTYYEYKKRKYCDSSCSCTQRNRDYEYPEEIRQKQSISMYKYYAIRGLYDQEKEGNIPYSEYKMYVQKRSQRTLKRENLILYNTYKDNPWNPKKPNDTDLTIEHKISIRKCYDCGISIKQASNVKNLEVITMKKNWENNK